MGVINGRRTIKMFRHRNEKSLKIPKKAKSSRGTKLKKEK